MIILVKSINKGFSISTFDKPINDENFHSHNTAQQLLFADDDDIADFLQQKGIKRVFSRFGNGRDFHE